MFDSSTRYRDNLWCSRCLLSIYQLVCDFCTMVIHFCIVFLSFLLIIDAQVQDGRSCQTPNRENGQCVSIYNCKVFIDVLSKGSGVSDNFKEYLRKSSCGFQSGIPFVCCPLPGTRNVDIKEPEKKDENSFSSYNFLRTPDCGRSNESLPKVVGGVAAKLGQFPWIVALGYRNRNIPEQPKWLCGGSLITYNHVLTAAHCVHNRRDLYLARLGELDLYDDNDGAQPTDIEITNVKIHENYTPSKYINDIAIITLARSAENLVGVSPICLPWENDKNSQSYIGNNPFVAGWGSLFFNGPSSSVLQVVSLPVVDNNQCVNAYARQSTIDESILCAGHPSGGKDACKGDSGGPLMQGGVESNLKFLNFYQIGVVSYGYRCAEAGYPGVYTRITHFLDWIGKNTVS
ncbi:hypothetical protein ABEB36_010744 [Hypothenemus hampei]|uniref:CLIP domain-containing serine protease n=1 Tax=Hypothenemus hampei TaxID=57062 RepID=A0ABD1ECY9_HYPHA